MIEHLFLYCHQRIFSSLPINSLNVRAISNDLNYVFTRRKFIKRHSLRYSLLITLENTICKWFRTFLQTINKEVSQMQSEPRNFSPVWIRGKDYPHFTNPRGCARYQSCPRSTWDTNSPPHTWHIFYICIISFRLFLVRCRCVRCSELQRTVSG